MSVQPRMPFGKHKGLLLSELPDSYLGWLFEQADLHGWLAAAVEHEYWERFDPPETPGASWPSVEAMPPVMRSVCSKVVEAGYRQLTLKNHPDVGGDERAMKAINEAAYFLRGLFGRDGR
jgi:hypothetical protein